MWSSTCEFNVLSYFNCMNYINAHLKYNVTSPLAVLIFFDSVASLSNELNTTQLSKSLPLEAKNKILHGLATSYPSISIYVLLSPS